MVKPRLLGGACCRTWKSTCIGIKASQYEVASQPSRNKKFSRAASFQWSPSLQLQKCSNSSTTLVEQENNCNRSQWYPSTDVAARAIWLYAVESWREKGRGNNSSRKGKQKKQEPEGEEDPTGEEAKETRSDKRKRWKRGRQFEYEAGYDREGAKWRLSSWYSYGPLPVISTYNPIYNMYNPTYNQL